MLNIDFQKSFVKEIGKHKFKMRDKIINPNSDYFVRPREVKVVEFREHGVTTVRDGEKMFDVYESQLVYQKSGTDSVFLRIAEATKS